MNSFRNLRLYLHILLGFICVVTLSTSEVKSQNISTVREIYDYDVGDEFHYKHSLGYANWTTAFISYRNIVITSKFIISNEEICYKRSIQKQEKWENDTNWTFINKTDSICYPQQDSLINGGHIDTVYVVPSLYNGRLINTLDNQLGPEETSLDYANGCGLAVYTIFDWASTYFWRDNLVYYKKGFEVWGLPVYVSLDDREFDLGKVSVYPNPAYNFIKIKSDTHENTDLTISTITGKKIKTLKIKSELTTIDISDFKSGMYILDIRNGDNRIFKKLIKE